MATYTSHYNLKKPATSDKIRIADFNGNADTIDATMYNNASIGAQLKADIGIVENTNTATHNISAGQYVIWKGDLYTASSAISTGATLSTANLTAVSGGGLNALNSNLSNLATNIVSLNVARSGDTINGGYIKIGKIVVVSFILTLASNVTANTAVVSNSQPASVSGTAFISGYTDAYGKRGDIVYLRDYSGTLITNTDIEAGTYIFGGCYIST